MKFDKLDLTNLDTVLQTHAYEYQRETEELPNLRNKMTEAKLEVERIESALYLKIRRELEDSGEKFTETKLTALIKIEPAYIEAQKNWLGARKAYDMIDHIRETFMQRELSIKNLVALYTSQYWSLANIDSLPDSKSDSDSKFKRR